jgi:hypothetical protein
LTFILVVFLVILGLTIEDDPTKAAGWVKSIGAWLTGVVESIRIFFDALLG